MKRIYLFLILILWIGSISILAQVPTFVFNDKDAFKFYPALSTVAKSIPARKMQPIDPQKLLDEDSPNDGVMGGSPFRFGYGFEVNYTLDDGVWDKSDTARIWSLKISSSGAYSLNFVFERLFLSEGAQLYIYNTDGSMVYGPVTAAQNPSGGLFLTDLVAGDEVIIRLFEPVKTARSSFLELSKVVHAYINIFPTQSKAPGAILDCHNDVNCYPVWKNESDGVASIVFASGEYVGSGCLLNNTRQDYRPYFLTGFHCVDTYDDGVLSSAEKNATQNWVFRFQYKSTTCNGSSATNCLSYNGGYLKAAWYNSDFALLELKDSPVKSGLLLLPI